MKYITVIITLLTILSCTPVTVYHKFKLIVVDENKQPVANATINYSYNQQGTSYGSKSFVTTTDSTMIDELVSDVVLLYTIKADGFESKTGIVVTEYGSGDTSFKDEFIVLHRSSMLHKYRLSFVDIDGNPIKNVMIDYTLRDINNENNKITRNSVVVNDFVDSLMVKRYVNRDESYEVSYLSKLIIKVTKDGYYPKLSSYFSDYGSTESLSGLWDRINSGSESKTITIPVIENEVVLIKPSDYFNSNFLYNLTDVELKKRMNDFIDIIIFQGLLTESVLTERSISLTQFKNKSYLQFRFTNTNSYNSLKLNKYDIAKKIFDDVIRKILNPLNQYIGKTNLFYGYDISIIGYTSNFANKEKAIPIEYRFLMPVDSVQKYKDKDITGQQLIDSSIILMDDERIDLRLQ